MDQIGRDVAASMRSLLKHGGFSLVVIGTLALGIGANTAMFSVINAALFRPLAIADEGRVVLLQEFRRGQRGDDGGVSYLDFSDWRAQSKAFSSMAIVGADEATLTVNSQPAGFKAPWFPPISSRHSESPRRLVAPSPPRKSLPPPAKVFIL